MTRLGQRREVRAAIPVDEVSEGLGCQDLHAIAPHIEVPGHFEVAGGLKADNERTVRLVLEDLRGMELEAAGVMRGVGGEAPDDLAVFFGVLEDSEGAMREG